MARHDRLRIRAHATMSFPTRWPLTNSPAFQLERREIREREIRSEPGCGGFGVPPVKASGRGRVADFPGGVHQQHVASTTADATDRQNTVNRL